jgi:hypothetical protein
MKSQTIHPSGKIASNHFSLLIPFSIAEFEVSDAALPNPSPKTPGIELTWVSFSKIDPVKLEISEYFRKRGQVYFPHANPDPQGRFRVEK